MLNKKKGLKLAVLSLIGLLGLTACDEDEIYAKPSDYSDPIVKIDGSSDIHHDVLSIIYDAMHDGSLSTKVLDEALYRYAASVFGQYNAITATDNSVTLKDAYVSYVKGNSVEKINAFIKAHKSYWNYNENGEHVDDDGKVVDDATFTPCNAERKHVESKYEAIEKRIATIMYEKSVESSNNLTNSFFSEAKFLRGLYEDGQKVTKPSEAKATIDAVGEIVVPYTVEKEDVFKEFDDFAGEKKVALHREFYQDSATKYESTDSKEGVKNTYIEDEIIPTIYNDLLVEQYLVDEDVAAVRNSRARKINVIKIARHSDFADNAKALKKHLVESIYTYKTEGLTAPRNDADQIEKDGAELFDTYATVAKGIYEDIQADEAAKKIVEDIQKNRSDIYQKLSKDIDGTLNYYKHTSYGDLVEDYDEIYTQVAGGDSKLIDSTLYSTFTSSGTRTLKEGFDQQKIQILQTESITRGWYIQSSTPALDSNGKINERLFKLSVANAKIEIGKTTDGVKEEVRNAAIQELKDTDRLVYDADAGKLVVREKASDKENKFLCSINGAYYLKFEGQYAEDEWINDIVYDDGNAYYVVQVLEAVKDMKLRNMSSNNYAQTRGQTVMDTILDDVAKIVGETGNYATLSKNHWLEKMDIYYFDQNVYDYFKSNYPDLFADEEN